jgi:hypothetical protein
MKTTIINSILIITLAMHSPLYTQETDSSTNTFEEQQQEIKNFIQQEIKNFIQQELKNNNSIKNIIGQLNNKYNKKAKQASSALYHCYRIEEEIKKHLEQKQDIENRLPYFIEEITFSSPRQQYIINNISLQHEREQELLKNPNDPPFALYDKICNIAASTPEGKAREVCMKQRDNIDQQLADNHCFLTNYQQHCFELKQQHKLLIKQTTYLHEQFNNTPIGAAYEEVDKCMRDLIPRFKRLTKQQKNLDEEIQRLRQQKQNILDSILT